MAEYNMTYSDLKKRLLTLKILINADTKLNDLGRNSCLSTVDRLLKDLDERYSEGKLLSTIEIQVEQFEKAIKK